MTIGPQRYMRAPRVVEVFRWGPTWTEMKAAVKWLGGSGISAQFDNSPLYADDEEYGLPVLYLFDERWDCITPTGVRIGDRIVVYGHRKVYVVPRVDFHEDYSIIEEIKEQR